LNLGEQQWRGNLGSRSSSLLFLIMLYGIPRSSRWLVTRIKRMKRCRSSKMMGSPDSEAELREMSILFTRTGYGSRALVQREYRLPIFLP